MVFTTSSLVLELSSVDEFTITTASVSPGPRVKTQQVWPASTAAAERGHGVKAGHRMVDCTCGAGLATHFEILVVG